MIKLSSVERWRRLPANRSGRDFIVGDLHGHFGLLEQSLDRLGFDTSRDRLFSVGDLVDRGPQSLATLALLDEPWFHAVLGNHELMLLNFLGCYTSRTLSRKGYLSRGGDWVLRAAGRERRQLERAVERLAALPLALHVEDTSPFNVSHGDLLPGCAPRDRSAVAPGEAERATTSRANVARLPGAALLHLRFGARTIRLSDSPLADGPLCYVGHSPLPEVTVHNALVYIDQRASERDGRAPTVIEHRPFARWLAGAVAALKASQPCAA